MLPFYLYTKHLLVLWCMKGNIAFWSKYISMYLHTNDTKLTGKICWITSWTIFRDVHVRPKIQQFDNLFWWTNSFVESLYRFEYHPKFGGLFMVWNSHFVEFPDEFQRFLIASRFYMQKRAFSSKLNKLFGPISLISCASPTPLYLSNHDVLTAPL